MLRQKTMRFISIIWKEYNYQLLIVLATLTSLIVDSFVAKSWTMWRVVPQILLVLCLVYFIWTSFGILRSIIPAPQIPYSICIGKPSDWFDSFARRQQEKSLRDIGIRWGDVQRIYRLHQTDWVFLSSNRISEKKDDWVQITRQLLDHFWDLQKRVETVPIHHFFFVAPPSIIFAFGAHIGRRVSHLAYHHVGNIQNPYLLVADTTTRDTSSGLDMLNQRISESSFEHISIERKSLGGSEHVIVTLDFTNHRMNPPYPLEERAKEIISVTHRNGIGHIPATDWEPLAREIASVILECSDKGTPIDIYVNTPIALAFIIGSIIGPIQGITLCEHNIYMQKFVRCFQLAEPKLQSVNWRTSVFTQTEEVVNT
jgi:hypothetical protein